MFTCIVGQDLDSFSSLVVFSAGVTKRTVHINTTDDALLENTKVFQISLSRLDVGVVIGEPSRAMVIITEDGKLEHSCMRGAYLY